MSYKEESKILKDCDNCVDDENGNTPKNSDSDKQNPDNEEKRKSNPDELIIVKDQDKEMKFKYPIKDDDEYYMYMIPDSIDKGKSLKSAEEYSKKNSASHSLKEKGKEVKVKVVIIIVIRIKIMNMMIWIIKKINSIQMKKNWLSLRIMKSY